MLNTNIRKKDIYSFSWYGKEDSIKLADVPTTNELLACPAESVDYDITSNIFIEGDNLDALKLLQESYTGKIKMIYIDPPYNTGKQFVYDDNFSIRKRDYIKLVGRKDLSDYEMSGRHHIKWLNMMYPRLKLARSLLKDDGVIFISIDDNEVANLRKICDEIFGEENFMANIVWQKKYTRSNDAKWFSDNHDHILCYAKNKELFKINQLPRNEAQLTAYRNPDSHPKGVWKATPLHAKSGTNTSPYTFINNITWAPPPGTFRRFSDQSMADMDKNDEIWFGEDGTQMPQRKSFLCDVKDGVTPTTLWPYKEVGHNHEANNELKSLGLLGVFNNPKPSRLVSRMITLSDTEEKDGLSLDFFSGSCTTAHAVMKLNAEDGGNRRHIMVQLPEPLDDTEKKKKENKNAIEFCDKYGFPRNIAEIGKERIRRAGKKIQEEIQETIRDKKKEIQAIKSQLDFDNYNKDRIKEIENIIKSLENQDLGFKVYKLVKKEN